MKAENDLNLVAKILLNSLNVSNALIRRRVDDKLILVSSLGYNDNEPEKIKKFREGVSGLSAFKNITIAVNDLDFYHKKYFKGFGNIKSTVSIPITVKDEVIGTINFASKSKYNFDKKKIEILTDFTNLYKDILIFNYIKNSDNAA